MKNNFLTIIIVDIIAIIDLGTVFTQGIDSNSEASDSNDWEVKEFYLELNLKFLKSMKMEIY